MTNTVPFEEDESRPRVETLAIAEIRQDEEIAARGVDPDIVAEFQERMTQGDEFPPLQVMRDGDGVNWLWDGWQRLEAATRKGVESIDCAIRKGDRRAALLMSAGANATHGLRRSAEDKRRAVQKLLRDAEWANWSDREIARQCKVSPTFVGEVRVSVRADSDGRRQFRTRHGGVSTMNTAAIGTKQGAKNVTHIYRGPTTRIPLDVPFTRGPDTTLKIKSVGYARDVPPDFGAAGPAPGGRPGRAAARREDRRAASAPRPCASNRPG
jgi:hypothetical protein